MSDSAESFSYREERLELNTASNHLFRACRDLTEKVTEFSKDPPEMDSDFYKEEKSTIKSTITKIRKILTTHPGKFPGFEALFATYVSDIEDYLKDPKGGVGPLAKSQSTITSWMTEFIMSR